MPKFQKEFLKNAKQYVDPSFDEAYKKSTDYSDEITNIDEVVKDGAYCVAPSDEDIKAFAEHARRRR